MISEPEMVGEFGTTELAETIGPEADEPRGPRELRGLRPWLWALGGAVVASAVWAGGLYALSGDDRGPDLRGYRVNGDLCDEAQVPALARELGRREDEPLGAVHPHAAVDRANCSIAFGEPTASKDGWFLAYSAWAAVELHKETDPAAEFEANLVPHELYPGVVTRTEVPGLGDQAFVVTDDALTGPQLVVRDGGAVFTLRVEVSVNYDGEDPPTGESPEPATDGIQRLMIEDMRALMSALGQ
ncbi:hypothetical protein [Streptomyces sp. NPDC051219]|uniref:hypothetical protein n=1 Tax=Streptomyces sp. NPDC051219 TaxID=3155283 RepID=UPI00343973D7